MRRGPDPRIRMGALFETMQSSKPQQLLKWVLVPCSAELIELGEIRVAAFPFRIGRLASLELCLPTRTVSARHATLTVWEGRLFIEDEGSRNGTFVNGVRIDSRTPLYKGDIVQLAQAVFRVDRFDTELMCVETVGPRHIDNALAIIEFDRLMADGLVVPHYQSIVEMATGRIHGYEALGRGTSDSMRTPRAMFNAAERMQQEAALSRLLRRAASEAFSRLGDGCKLFLNSHHCEVDHPRKLIDSVRELRDSWPDHQVVLEIHESTVTNLTQMQFLAEELRQLNVEIAYDDFGAGQARFFELIEEPPSYLKFDIRLIKNLHVATPRRRRTIERLVSMVQGLGIECLAEGIEVADEAAACRDVGFTLAQGYFYSRPVTVEGLVTE